MRKRVWAAGGTIAVLAVVIGVEIGIRSAALPAGLDAPPPSTPVLEDIRGRPFSSPAADFARDARPARLREFGRWLPAATVAVEDHRFPSHPGIDAVAMTGAAIRNIRNGRIISGASTITQQTVKLASGRTRRTLDAKWREAFSALRLEREWSKDKILEAYLNRLDYGNRRIGPVAAAWAYFGKSPDQLTCAEAIYLAGIPQSPSRLNPWKNPQNALERFRRNVRRMDAAGLLPPGMRAEDLPPPVPGRFAPASLAPHFTRAAQSRIGAGSSARRTTLDLDLQSAAERVAEAARTPLADVGAGACAIVILDNATGGVRAMVSSSTPQFRDVNLAMSARSAGSTLKPFLYLDAIERRIITAATLLPDTEEAVREAYPDYDPRNYNDRFEGPVRAREALGNSLNVPAVVLASRCGARDAFARLGSWGVGFQHDFDAYGAGFILGNAEVSLLDLTGAYASLARTAAAAPDSPGTASAWKPVLLAGEPTEPLAAGSPAAAAIITDILCDSQARRASFGNASPLESGARVAVKTGTSSGFRDGWCIGFTRSHTIGVWAGNPDGTPMHAALAVRSAAPVWQTLVGILLAQGDEGLPKLVPGEALECASVSAETGLIPRPGEPGITEWFLRGSAPAASSDSMYRSAAGRQALVLPHSYAGWCASPQNRKGAVAQSPALEILFPKDGAVFAINPALPDAQQILIPRSSDPACEWFANGEKLPSPRLPLRPGEFTLTARAHGEERTSRFRVE